MCPSRLRRSTQVVLLTPKLLATALKCKRQHAGMLLSDCPMMWIVDVSHKKHCIKTGAHWITDPRRRLALRGGGKGGHPGDRLDFSPRDEYEMITQRITPAQDENCRAGRPPNVESYGVEMVVQWLGEIGIRADVHAHVRRMKVNGLTLVLMPPADWQVLGCTSDEIDTVMTNLMRLPTCTRGDTGGLQLYEEAWALKERVVRKVEARADTPSVAGPAKRRAVDGRSLKDKLGGYIGDDGKTRYFCAGCPPGAGLGPRSLQANNGKGWTVVKGSAHPLIQHWDLGTGGGNCNRDYHVMRFNDKDYTNVHRVEWEVCVKFGLLPRIPPQPSAPPPL